MNHLSLTSRTLLLLGVMAVILGGAAVYARSLLLDVDAAYSRLVEDTAIGQAAAADGTRAILRAQRELYRALLAADRPAEATARLAASRQAQALVTTATALAAARLRVEGETAGVAAVQRELGLLTDAAATMIAAGQAAEARAMLGAQLDRLTITSRDATDRLTANSRAHAERENARLSGETGYLLILLQAPIVAALVVGVIMAWLLLQRGAARPLMQLAKVGRALAAGDLDHEIPSAGRRDEVGQIAAAIVTLREAALHARRLEAEAEATRLATEADRLLARRDLADRVERQLGDVVQGLAGSAGALEDTIVVLSTTAGQTAERASAVSAGATEATNNVQTVAAAAEELASSVGEITRQVAQAAQVASQAVREADTANGTVTSLSEAAARIGNVVQLIGAIASQTNLLALNATIEAARAGDAGKGFAVVASEVKALAGQTASATEEISQQIAAIQEATGRAVHSIQGIAGVVGQVDQIAAAIAAAVEEQGAATREIARNVSEAAQGTTEVSANIAHVSLGVDETTGSLRLLRDATGEVTRQGSALRGGLHELLGGLRAG